MANSQKTSESRTNALNMTPRAGHGTNTEQPKPPIKEFIESPNCESRNGAIINRIVLHFTDDPRLDVVISTFKNPDEKVSAHYVIAKNGDIYQMVRDGDKAWHCKGANAHTIGIEHVAAKNDHLAPDQEKASIALIRWLVGAYKVNKAAITGHRYTPDYSGGVEGTDCPHSLFGPRTEAAIRDWVDANI